jgi:para-aminobenzoate synthetase / 4-amino-4-deoxychorismate lyase
MTYFSKTMTDAVPEHVATASPESGLVTARPSIIFCEDRGREESVWLCCRGLVEVLQAKRLEEISGVLATVERAVRDGLYAAGFLAYEAAPAMDDACSTHTSGGLPLARFGLFRDMAPLQQSWWGSPTNADHPLGMVPGRCPSTHPTLVDWQPSISRQQYGDAIHRIKHYIAQGDTYQVNHTFRLRSPFCGDAWPFFLRLCQAQRPRYGAFLDIGSHVICSASPELFFQLDGQRIVCRPMKGTSPRGQTAPDDQRLRSALSNSAKDRAENAMIVDMVRNDIGRIARPGTVRVESAFDVEPYPTLFQMTSTVAGTTSASFAEIMRALFPAASITGAPKIRTMQIIRELEPDARGVYTGCIGYLAPGRQARFSVAIRTVTIDRAAGQAEYGVGGGIVWDSTAEGEYAECCTKAAILARNPVGQAPRA